MKQCELWRGATTQAEQKLLRTPEQNYPTFTPTEKNWLESSQILLKIRRDTRCLQPRRLRADPKLSQLQVGNKVEWSFRVLKRIFGFTKVRYRGLKKNHEWLCAGFALANLYLKRKRLTMINLRLALQGA
jgi:hypothetical protein